MQLTPLHMGQVLTHECHNVLFNCDITVVVPEPVPPRRRGGKPRGVPSPIRLVPLHELEARERKEALTRPREERNSDEGNKRNPVYVTVDTTKPAIDVSVVSGAVLTASSLNTTVKQQAGSVQAYAERAKHETEDAPDRPDPKPGFTTDDLLMIMRIVLSD